jgi:uncharacterized oligopeptide transporter (OPT) family protein
MSTDDKTPSDSPSADPCASAARPVSYREVTLAAILFGLVVGALMNASITYAGLKIGFTIGGSTIAAVLGFGVLRGLLRRGSILETNIGQTVASAVNIPNSGIIFTVPVLLLLSAEQYNFQKEFRPDKPLFWLLTLACVAGAVLGCAFIIPIRKQMIDIDRLRFPTGTAVAAILKSPGAGIKKTLVLLSGMALAMLIYLPAGLPSIKLGEAPAAGQKDERQALWGYGDLGWRLRSPRPVDPDVPEDQLRYEREFRRLDRDNDKKPDLVLTHDHIDVGRLIGLPDQVLFVFAIAPFALGAGYITGRPGLLVLAGGILAFWVLNPFVFSMGWTPDAVAVDKPAKVETRETTDASASAAAQETDENQSTANKPGAAGDPVEGENAEPAPPAFRAFEAADMPNYGYKAFNRPLGIGMLLGGALMGMLAALPSIREALKSLALARSRGSKGKTRELGLGVLTAAAVAATLGLFVAADLMIGGNEGWLGRLNPHVKSLIVALIGAAWIWFGGIIIAQCTGMTDWSPISGMALLTVVLVMLLVGTDQVAAAVLIGAAMCVAITCAADMMQDLKTGHLVGARPIRQQVVELATTGIGPVITMFTILLIVSSNMASVGQPIGPDTPTTAPQAQALGAVIEGVRGGDVAYALYGCGAVLGILLGLGAFSGLGVLVGLSMYLPIEYILTYGVGCLIAMGVSKIKGKTWAEEWGVPFSAGLIVGEALLSLVINGVVLAMG